MKILTDLFFVSLGWLGGWLVNYLADVLPLTRRFSQPVCLNCQAPLSLSRYLWLKPCHACGKQRPLRAWIVQGAMPLMALGLVLFPHPYLPSLLTLTLVLYFALVIITDLEYRVILHQVSLFGVGLGFITGLVLRGRSSLTEGAMSTLLGGVVGFTIMLFFYWLGKVYVKYMAKKRGLSEDEIALGYGDVNLTAIIGLMLGWPGILIGLFYGILAGGIVSLFLILRMLLSRNYQAFLAIPYAPFLALAALYVLLTL
ncbi:MAG: prepilin peptidase [Anaerolineales bacterium]|nr:prepilin peptidase [Anaerolineales bacterium]MCX7609244.1 prepilin peptidase [Anaerolineales bacterium]MDW8227872.1 A24 family peptidase [Anaerolineales bacterium]